jgi:hypothetical protein
MGCKVPQSLPESERNKRPVYSPPPPPEKFIPLFLIGALNVPKWALIIDGPISPSLKDYRNAD